MHKIMEESFFIIHNSAIIRSGLSSILNSYFKVEAVQLATPEEIIPFCHTKNKLIIIAIQENLELPKSVITMLEENNLLVTIAISHQNTSNSLYNFTLHIDSDSLQIQQTIQLARKSINKHKTTAQNFSNDELTQREIDVIKKIALGHANKDIADALCISIHTVISHRKNITDKLNIKSISGLTVYAIMNNLLDISEIKPDELI